ncbi:unnamed protein product [Prunus armeniaca]
MGSSSLIQAHLQGWAVSPMESARLDAWPSDRAYRFLGLLLSLCKEGPPPIVAISLREIEAWVDPPEASVAVSGHDAERVILSCDFQDGPFTGISGHVTSVVLQGIVSSERSTQLGKRADGFEIQPFEPVQGCSFQGGREESVFSRLVPPSPSRASMAYQKLSRWSYGSVSLSLRAIFGAFV